MVSKPGNTAPTKYAPVNEASRDGVIKYLNQGLGSIREKRREDAYKQMSQSCGGAYRIDAEGPRAEGGYVTPVGNSAAYSDSQYWYIQFSCVKAATDSAKSS